MPADNLVPLTKLEAVNLMLDSIGEQPLSSLDGQQPIEASSAIRILDRVSREVQQRGRQFNTETNYTLMPSGGFYTVPENTAQIRAFNPGIPRVVLRGNKLYDRDNHTFTFTTTSMQVDIVFYLNFEDLPAYARDYIAIRAGRQFQDSVMGSQVYHAYTEQNEVEARAAFNAAEQLTGRPTIFDTIQSAKALQRRTRSNI